MTIDERVLKEVQQEKTKGGGIVGLVVAGIAAALLFVVVTRPRSFDDTSYVWGVALESENLACQEETGEVHVTTGWTTAVVQDNGTEKTTMNVFTAAPVKKEIRFLYAHRHAIRAPSAAAVCPSLFDASEKSRFAVLKNFANKNDHSEKPEWLFLFWMT